MLDSNTFVILVWLFFLVASSTAALRLLTRQNIMAEPYDNALSLLSLLTFFMACIINTFLSLLYFRPAQHSSRISASLPPSFFKLQFGSTILQVTCIWLAKLSLLASYHRLSSTFRPLKRAWYLILWMLIMAYASSVIGYPFAEPTCSYSMVYMKELSSVLIYMYRMF